MNSFKQNGNYVYHLLQHSTALPLDHRVSTRYASGTQEHTDRLLNSCDWQVFIIETDCVLYEIRTEYSHS